MTLPRTLTIVRSDDLRHRIETEVELDRDLGLAPKIVPPFVPTRERPAAVMVGRGVHFLPWFDFNGNPLAVAVQSNGRVAHWQSWLPGQSFDDFVADLRQTLNNADPVGQGGETEKRRTVVRRSTDA